MSEAPPLIVPITGIDARMAPYDWAFARTERERIAAHWTKLTAEKPRLFNGQVLLQHQGHVADGLFHARYFQIDYAAFLAWQHFGNPGPAIRNGFAMAALETRDGAFLLGRMAAHTANAGKVYFAAGTPDLDDVLPDGTVDLAGSVLRELCEETGLRADEVTAHDRWQVVMTPTRAAFMRKVSLDLPAAEARALILSRLPTHTDGELDDIVIVRGLSDLDPVAMPPFLQTYLRHRFTA